MRYTRRVNEIEATAAGRGAGGASVGAGRVRPRRKQGYRAGTREHGRHRRTLLADAVTIMLAAIMVAKKTTMRAPVTEASD